MVAILPVPIRDATTRLKHGKFPPFYSEVHRFLSDGDEQIVDFEDSPRARYPWKDPREDAPAPSYSHMLNQRLRRTFFRMSFTAWLAVINEKWADHDMTSSLVYLGHFNWSISLDSDVDMLRRPGSWVQPQEATPSVSRFRRGRGKRLPMLAAPAANATIVADVYPADEFETPAKRR
jgi:hypothetical protein